MTLVAELYLNFWYLGICFGALSVGILFKLVDKSFLKIRYYEVSVQWIYYFQLIGLLLFVLRGSFLSAFAYSTAVAFSWIAILCLQRLLHTIRSPASS
jgi:hypothetical protein